MISLHARVLRTHLFIYLFIIPYNERCSLANHVSESMKALKIQFACKYQTSSGSNVYVSRTLSSKIKGCGLH